MFIRLEKVPVYERHLLFCSDLDERHTPDYVISMFATLPNGDARPGNQDQSIARPLILSSAPRGRRLN